MFAGVTQRDVYGTPRDPEFGLRTAIDTLFGSVAKHHGSGAIAVLLSGTMRDGVEGMSAICSQGGITILENPETASFAELPRAAEHRLKPDYICNKQNIPSLLLKLIQSDFSEGSVDDEEPSMARAIDHEAIQRRIDAGRLTEQVQNFLTIEVELALTLIQSAETAHRMGHHDHAAQALLAAEKAYATVSRYLSSARYAKRIDALTRQQLSAQLSHLRSRLDGLRYP